MEKHSRERSGVLKSALAAGVISLAGGKLEAQNFGNWRALDREKFEQLHIPEDMIQRVDASQDSIRVESDHSKAARMYTDRSGRTYYWVNTKIPKAGFVDMAEEKLLYKEIKIGKKTAAETLLDTEPIAVKENETENPPPPISDTEVGLTMEIPADAPVEETTNVTEELTEDKAVPEISDTPPLEEKDLTEIEMDTIMVELEEYAKRFEVKEAYVTSSDGKVYKIDDLPVEAFKNTKDETTLSGALVIYDKETEKEYAVPKRNKSSLTNDIFYFAEALKNSGTRGGCLEFLKRNGKTNLPVDEKIKYLEEFFTNRIKDLKEYKEPRIDESELRSNTTAEERG